MRNMPFNQRLLLTISIFGGFILLVIAMLLSYIWSSGGTGEPPFLELLSRFHFELMIAVSFLGIGVGAAMYFLMQAQTQEKAREATGNAKLLLSFLSGDERAVVELLLKSEGHTTQAEVSRLEDMTRLRAHRVVLRLVDKKIIRVEKMGKTNQLWLAKSIFEALSEGERN